MIYTRYICAVKHNSYYLHTKVRQPSLCIMSPGFPTLCCDLRHKPLSCTQKVSIWPLPNSAAAESPFVPGSVLQKEKLFLGVSLEWSGITLSIRVCSDPDLLAGFSVQWECVRFEISAGACSQFIRVVGAVLARGLLLMHSTCYLITVCLVRVLCLC